MVFRLHTTMTFVPNGDVDPSTKLELDETAQSVLNPLSGVADQPKNGKAFLAPFAPVIFVEATDTSLSVGLNNTKYKPINVPDAENAPIAHVSISFNLFYSTPSLFIKGKSH